MSNVEGLQRRYRTDAPFNQMVNLFRQLIEEYQFLPQELRDGLFLAQWHVHHNSMQEIMRSEEDFRKIEVARKIAQKALLDIENIGEILPKAFPGVEKAGQEES